MAIDCGILKLAIISVLAGVILSTIVGPKDPRYPDYIIDPKVTCKAEGVFPHPRNCSWFYWCVDRMKVGYYHTYHYECAPGTAFADGLGQCVFPYLINNPCGGPIDTIVTTVVIQSSTKFVSTPVNTVALPPTTIVSNVPSNLIITAPSTTVISPAISTIVSGQVTTVYTMTAPPSNLYTTTVIVGTNTQYVLTSVSTVASQPTSITSHVPSLTHITGPPTTVIDPHIYTIIPGQVTKVYPFPVTRTTIIIGGSTSIAETSVNTNFLPPITITNNVPDTLVITGSPTTIISPPSLFTVIPGQETTFIPQNRYSTTIIVGGVTSIATQPVATTIPPPVTITAQVSSTMVLPGVITTIIVTRTTNYIPGQLTTYVPATVIAPLTTVIVGTSTLIASVSVNTQVPPPITSTAQVLSTVVITGSFTTMIVGAFTNFIPGQITTYVPEITTTSSPSTLRPTPTLPTITTTKPPVTPASITTSTTPDEGLVNSCKFIKDSCKIYDLCSPTKATKILCRGCYMGDNFFVPASISPGCPDGFLVDRENKKCFEEPKSTSLCSTRNAVGSEDLLPFRCNALRSRPDNEWIRNQYCTPYAFCDENGILLGFKSLCSNFYQCYRTPDGGWKSELRNCIAGNLYSFDEDQCVSQPRDEDLCFWH